MVADHEIIIDIANLSLAQDKLNAINKLYASIEYRAAVLSATTLSVDVDNRLASQSIQRLTDSFQRLQMMQTKIKVEIKDEASKKTESLIEKFDKFTAKSWKVVIGVKDFTKKTIKSITGAITSFATKVKKIGGAVIEENSALLKLSGQMEQATISFGSLIGSAAKAKSFLAELQSFSNKTTFELPGLIDSAKELMSFGFRAEEVLPLMSAIGNASAGLGLDADGIAKVTDAFGDFKRKGQIDSKDLLELTKVGIPAMDILAEKMGASTEEYIKFKDNGVLPANEAIDALIAGMNDRFPGMMDKQASSLLGLWSTLKKTFSTGVLYKWGEGLRQGIQPELQKIVDWVKQNESQIKQWGDRIQQVAGQAASWMSRKFEETMGNLKTMFNDPQFQNADLFGKIGIAWDVVIGDSFTAWFGGSGQGVLADVASKIGSALGQVGNGLLSGVMAAISGDPDKLKDENPYAAAGQTAGTAFFNAFAAAFNPADLAQKAAKAFAEVNIKPFKDPTVGNILTAVVVDAAVTRLGTKLLKKPAQMISKKFFKKTAAKTAGTAAEVVMEAAGPVTKARKGIFNGIKGWFSGKGKGKTSKPLVPVAEDVAASSAKAADAVAESAAPTAKAGKSLVDKFKGIFRGKGKGTASKALVPVAGDAVSGSAKATEAVAESIAPVAKARNSFMGKIKGFFTGGNQGPTSKAIAPSAADIVAGGAKTTEAVAESLTPAAKGWKGMLGRVKNSRGLIKKTAAKALGRTLTPLSIGLDLLDIAQAPDGNERTKRTAGALGGMGGTYAGALTGAAIGSAVPIIGTALGGLIGGAVGYFGGSWGGREIGGLLNKWGLFKKKKPDVAGDVAGDAGAIAATPNVLSRTLPAGDWNRGMLQQPPYSPPVQLNDQHMQAMQNQTPNVNVNASSQLNMLPGSVQIDIHMAEKQNIEELSSQVGWRVTQELQRKFMNLQTV